MNEASVPVRPERIVVALDASPQSVAALKAAVEMAALLEAEVEGLFVEDINLIHLCAFPFCHEIGSYTARLRPVDNKSMERHLRVIAGNIRQAMEQAATQAHSQSPVRWSFRVSRGPVVTELLAAAQSASLLSIGRAGQVRQRSLGSTTRLLMSRSQRPLFISGEGGGLRYPLTVVYTGSPAAERALQLAVRLIHHAPKSLPPANLLRVVVWGNPAEQGDLVQLEQAVRRRLGQEQLQAVVVHVSRSADLPATLRLHDGGIWVLPGEQSALVAEHSGPVLLVP
jgi:nucleotide-binding universal stress UspA family protein